MYSAERRSKATLPGPAGVGETTHRIWKISKVGVVFQRIAIFQNPAGSVVAVDIHHQRIIRPLAHLMRQRRNVLRECAHVVHISSMGIRLRRARAAGRAVITADAAGVVLGQPGSEGQLRNGANHMIGKEYPNRSKKLKRASLPVDTIYLCSDNASVWRLNEESRWEYLGSLQGDPIGGFGYRNRLRLEGHPG